MIIICKIRFIAWFTSSRVFSTEVANFSVVEAEGALDCAMTPVAGAGTVVGAADNTVKVADDAVLTHGSVDHSTGIAYVINPEGSPKFLGRGLYSSGNWLYKDNATIKNSGGTEKTVDVYIAVAWTMTFTYSFKSETASVAVYLDTKASTMGDATPNEDYNFTKTVSGANDTEKGFRIGFFGAVNKDTTVAATGKHDVVWGNNIPMTAPSAWAKASGYSAGNKVLKDGTIYEAKETIAANSDWDSTKWKVSGDISLATATPVDSDAEYVSSDSATTDYTALNYVYSKDQARVADGAETAGTVVRAERICVLSPTNPSVTVTCAAWFEGTDPNVVSGNTMSCLKANMTFYSRSLLSA